MILNLFIFIFGLAVGSFLNCVIYRLDVRRPQLDVARPNRSYCPYCKHKLSWQDLIPVFSFLILKGKCRHCSKKISLQYPVVELVTAILFVLIFWILGFGFDLIFGFWILITCFLVIIFVYDLKHYIIPDKIIFPAIIIALIFNFQGAKLLSALGAAGFFLLIVLVSRGKWMGLGDVKLAFLIGLLLGFPAILVALFSAFLIGAIIGIGLIVAKGKTLKSEVPFGPFLVAGTFIALFWADKIIQFYEKLFYLN